MNEQLKRTAQKQSTKKSEDLPAEQVLPLDQIRTDGGTQPRESVHDSVVSDYADRVAEGDTFPPVVVYYDGENYWLADGFHRLAAFRSAGRKSIAAVVRQGTTRDALLYAIEANARQGQRFTNADKRHAVTLLLSDPEWSQRFSNREVARRVGVSHEFVNQVRREMATVATADGAGEVVEAAPENPDDLLERWLSYPHNAEDFAGLPPPFPALPQITHETLDALLRCAAGLRQIRDRHLYRQTHADFYGYCQERWNLKREIVDAGFDVLEVVERRAAA